MDKSRHICANDSQPLPVSHVLGTGARTESLVVCFTVLNFGDGIISDHPRVSLLLSSNTSNRPVNNMLHPNKFISRLAGAVLALLPRSAPGALYVAASHRHAKRTYRPLLLAAVLTCSLFAFASPAFAKTAMQAYVEAMQPGINLGNTLDAIPTETSWGSPLITQEMIQGYATQGFKSIRIPVSWDSHMGGAPDYTIDPVWMDRVQQIVDWSLDAGLYVMLNLHHDSWQ